MQKATTLRLLLTLEIEEGEEGSLYINTPLRISHEEGGLEDLIDTDDVYASLDEVFGHLHEVMKNLDYEQQLELVQRVPIGDGEMTLADYRALLVLYERDNDKLRDSLTNMANHLLSSVLDNIDSMEPDLQYFFWNGYARETKERLLKALRK